MLQNKLNNYLVLFFTLIPLIAIVTVKYFHIDAMSLAAVLVILLFIFLLIRNKNVKIEKYIFYYLLFVIYQILLDAVKVPHYTFNIKRFYADSYLIPIFVFILIENTYITEDTYNRIIKYSKPILVIAAIVIVYQATINNQFLVNTNYIEHWYRESDFYQRNPSIYSWLSSLGVGLVFIPTLAIIIGDKLFKNEKNVLLWYVIGFIVAILTLSRWVMLNMLVLVLMYLLVKRVNIKQTLKISFYVILILFTTYFILDKSGININQIIEARILQGTESGGIQSNTAYSRILAFKFFGELFPLNPIFGHGGYKGSALITMLAQKSSQIHVGYLSLLYYWGIIGGILYSLFLYYLLKKMFRISRITDNWGPFFGWLCFIIANLTLVYLGPDQIGLYLSLAVAKYLRDKKLVENESLDTSKSEEKYVLAAAKN